MPAFYFLLRFITSMTTFKCYYRNRNIALQIISTQLMDSDWTWKWMIPLLDRKYCFMLMNYSFQLLWLTERIDFSFKCEELILNSILQLL